MAKIKYSPFAITGLTLVLISILNLNYAEAHVSLTFPPARKYNLDYLDSGSPPPCGMPKGLVATSLISGSTFNVTWHLGYPHQGTHRLELLSSNGTEIHTLASELDTNDPTAQRHQVTLPNDFVCSDCIIRLKRQSGELGNPEFWFWSCGDVEIVQKDKYVESCTGNGKVRSDGVCGCRSGFWGKHCQYEDECRKDFDCGDVHGKCIDLGGTNLPRRQCFCQPGYIGKKCSKPSNPGKIPLPNINTLTDEYLEANYLNETLDRAKRVNLFWRFIEGETLQMEFVLIVDGTSYVALGWRPLHFQGDCTRYPHYPSAELSSNSISKRSRLGRQTSDVTNTSEILKVPPPRRDDVPPFRRTHPMSCMDTVIGAARGSLSRILDYWSGGISTPREDSLWNGGDDIVAGGAWESTDGFTTLVFRKNVHSKDIKDKFNDWPLDGPTFMIWARGQEHEEYVHSLPSGVDPGQPASVPKYYTRDELKYHGFIGQRGSFAINFAEEGAREFFQSRPFNQ